MKDADEIVAESKQAIAEMWRLCIEGSIDCMEALFRRCESPIERLLLVGLFNSFVEINYTSVCAVPFRLEFDLLAVPSLRGIPVSLSIIPQYEFTFDERAVRVDFLFHLTTVNHTEPQPAIEFIVEADGHDFHERTKEQAASDKSRDRLFAQRGIHVLRFTGSEIYRDTAKCCREIVNLVHTNARLLVAQ